MVAIAVLCTLLINAQQPLTMERVVNEYALNSPAAKQQTLQYENRLLAYINYKRSFLPVFSLNLSPLSFNRSIKSLQDATTGKYSYIEDYTNSATGGVGIKQSIGVTGGTLSLGSNINMLSEFKDDITRFSTNILNVSYSQQLFGGYRNYKLQKKITHNEYENAIREYCENIAKIQHNAVLKFLELYLLKVRQDAAQYNISVADTLLKIGRIKYENGALTEQQQQMHLMQ